jgi:hypothetical protein
VFERDAQGEVDFMKIADLPSDATAAGSSQNGA